MSKIKQLGIGLCLSLAIWSGCKDHKPKEDPKENPVVKPSYTMAFDADSAYQFVAEQVNFGPRVPGTVAHGLTAHYLHQQLLRFCDTAFIQLGNMNSPDYGAVAIKNIIGSVNREAKKRILLCAHWDTRPAADEDSERPTEPADGANDGASGVGVLIEVARQLQLQQPDVGVDIIFFDAEDMGTASGGQESWCLGSQYWAKNKHVKGYNAAYGMLLDMVGAGDAVFMFERHSTDYAKWLVHHVWRMAASLGHGNKFLAFQGGYITDDHYFINQMAGIPTIDIIDYDMHQPKGFGEYWHTHLDNMSVIDRSSLKAVGETVLKTVWEEDPAS